MASTPRSRRRPSQKSAKRASAPSGWGSPPGGVPAASAAAAAPAALRTPGYSRTPPPLSTATCPTVATSIQLAPAKQRSTHTPRPAAATPSALKKAPAEPLAGAYSSRSLSPP